MIRLLVLIILASATLLPSAARAYEVLILQSRRIPAYEEVLKGFRAEIRASQRLIVLSDYAEVDIVQIVREDHPHVVLAIGDAALAIAQKAPHIPVAAVMALGIRDLKATMHNLTGIDMFAPPEQYVRVFKSLKARRVGIICNQARTGWYLHLARKAAMAAGIELVTREVVSPHDTMKELATLSGKIDALWVFPDLSAISGESAEGIFNFGLQQGIPVVSFAASHLGLGAAAAIEIDRTAMGRQTGGMVETLLNGTHGDAVPLLFPRIVTIKPNTAVLKRLGASLAESQ